MPLKITTRGMTDQERHFHMEEYRLLRAEVAYYVENSYRAAWLTLASLAAVYSVMIGTGTEFVRNNFALLRFLPVLIAVAGALIALGTYSFIRKYGAYLSDLEARLGCPDLGWDRRSAKTTNLGGAVALFWFALITATLTGACVLRVTETHSLLL